MNTYYFTYQRRGYISGKTILINALTEAEAWIKFWREYFKTDANNIKSVELIAKITPLIIGRKVHIFERRRYV